MAQHDYTIANQTFPNTRADLNNVFAAIVSQNSGATAPSTTYAYQLWYDTTTDILKMRNANDDAWVELFTIDQTADTATASGAGAAQGSNLVINGAMQIAQRGTSDTVDGGGWDYVIDRFCALGQASGGVFTYSQDSDAPAGFQKSLKVAVTTADTSLAAGDIYTIRHTIEGYNSAHLNFGTSDAKTVTLSFWVKSSLTGTFGGALNSEGNNRSYAFTYSISSANTWEYKTITIPGDTSGTWGVTNSHGVRITWGLGVGTTYSGTAGSWAGSEYFSATGATSVLGTASATWQMTGVQFEVGDTATPFDHTEDYGTTLAKCQRYYQLVDGAVGVVVGLNTTVQIMIRAVCDMRATPSLAVTTLRYTDCTTADFSDATVTIGAANVNLRGGRMSTGMSTTVAVGKTVMLLPTGANAAPVQLSAEL